MFAKPLRLRQDKQFAKIFRQGTWVRGRAFSLVVLPASHSGKIGFIITKKVTKSAVERNRTKRRIRATFMTAFQESAWASLLKSWLMIVVIHRLVDDEAPQTLTSQTHDLLRKLAALPTR